MAYRLPVALRLAGVRFMASGSGVGEFGAGAGKGGGTGGAVRDAGGAFGKMEAAHEELYFKKLNAIQLQRIKDHLEEEVDHHLQAIRDHQEAIERHKKKIKKLQHQEKDISD
ncbi:ATPase inhibitor mai-2, mitochondrial-like isoform X1 [Babylonia areolata]|uniref:ATPase inhibitor mai-2, mitochondrial-like isoform X1 n=2 Tax=Babylonia areolata TaxID=304850 RepID=UPI003FD5F265